MTHKTKIIFLLILSLGALFRFTGLNWDHNNHLHPDERFLTMVGNAITWPTSFTQYLDTNASPLNPHNHNFNFYVYGTYPVYLVKLIAHFLTQDTYHGLVLVGRATSALFDLGTLVLVFLITHKLTSRTTSALLAMFSYAVSVLPIQLSHFFAVDPYLTFFLALSFYALLFLTASPGIVTSVFLGIFYALAVSAKISALLFLPLIGLFFIHAFLKTKKIIHLFLYGLVTFIVFLTTLRVSYPYLFSADSLLPSGLNERVLDNWRQLKSFDNSQAWFPPATMWINAPSYSYPLENLLLWGLGLPLGAVSLLSLPYILIHYRRHLLLLVGVWILWLFLYQGAQFAMPMRYFYPIYPFLAVSSGVFMHDLSQKLKRPGHFLLVGFGTVLLFWPVSFLSIYTRPHARVEASTWIQFHIPPGSTLSCEHWDDCLPLGGPGNYTFVEFPLFNPDTPQKWLDMAARLDQIDYIVLTSNRLYGSIMTVPARFPTTSTYYQKLFSGELGFTKIAEFSSRPNLPIPSVSICLTPPGIYYGKIAFSSQECPLPGVSFVDDYADETFTVYDHPKVLIFQKTTPLDYSSLLPVHKI